MLALSDDAILALCKQHNIYFFYQPFANIYRIVSG